MLIEDPLNVAAKWVQFSSIGIVELTVCHLIPLYTEKVAIFCGGIRLFMDMVNWFSLLITVNWGEP